MRAFLSYSINDRDQTLLTLLSNDLQKRNIDVWTSQNFYNKILDFNTMSQIKDSHLFIGVITKVGIEKNRVIDELNFAKKSRIPNILLVENNVGFSNTQVGNVIRFSRQNPRLAIDLIHKKLSSNENNENALAWILGGAALIALLAYLDKGKS
jgi:hypothetical protein